VKRWWWANPTPGTILSKEEYWARGLLWFAATVIFFVQYFPGEWLLELVGVDVHFAPPLAGLFSLPFALIAARPVGERLWPKKIRSGDEKANARSMN
jgi:hypothetical protein